VEDLKKQLDIKHHALTELEDVIKAKTEAAEAATEQKEACCSQVSR
jgi:hypothetical protein